MRPLFMEFPETTAEGQNTDFLFMLGPSLLVKPATMLDDEKE
jgi:alpha-glucosidase (family GH31 glycosyl hydrolase)